jgi:hypothetical protein
MTKRSDGGLQLDAFAGISCRRTRTYEMENPKPYSQPFQHAIPSVGSEIGNRCEVGTYERLTNTKGEKVILKAGFHRTTQLNIDAKWSARSALVLIKDMDDPSCPRSELSIQSFHMKHALKECVPMYANFDIERKTIVFTNEPRCVFHHRRALIRHHDRLDQAGQTTESQHVKFLLDYMFNTLSQEVRHFYQFMENPVLHPGLDFFSLWMAFVPGEMVYLNKKCNHMKVQGRLMRLVSMNRCTCSNRACESFSWTLGGHMIDYDGQDLGHVSFHATIAHYDGVRALQDLSVIPLQYHPDKKKISEDLLARGKTFVRLIGRHYQQFTGVGYLLGDDRDLTSVGEADHFPLRSIYV